MSTGDETPVELSLQLSEAKVLKWAVKVAEDAVAISSQEDTRVDAEQSANIVMMLHRMKTLLDEAMTKSMHPTIRTEGE